MPFVLLSNLNFAWHFLDLVTFLEIFLRFLIEIILIYCKVNSVSEFHVNILIGRLFYCVASHFSLKLMLERALAINIGSTSCTDSRVEHITKCLIAPW